MKKIAFIAFLLAVCVAAGRAQESRQDVSLSGTGLIEPFIGSSTDVYVHSTAAYGALASYRFMLTPNSAVEANYGITYQNKITFDFNGPYHNQVLTIWSFDAGLDLIGAFFQGIFAHSFDLRFSGIFH